MSFEIKINDKKFERRKEDAEFWQTLGLVVQSGELSVSDFVKLKLAKNDCEFKQIISEIEKNNETTD